MAGTNVALDYNLQAFPSLRIPEVLSKFEY